MAGSRTTASKPGAGNKRSSPLKVRSNKNTKSNHAQKKTAQSRNAVAKAHHRDPKGNSTNSPPKQALQTQGLQPAGQSRLPPCPGPQLGIFKDHEFDIEWMERLDDDLEEHTEGHVFRAKIRSRLYALKVFKDYDVESDRFYWEAYLDSDHDPQEVTYYTDPFYNECRAYGRIQAAFEEKTLLEDPAMPCYGYLFLRDKDEETLAQRGLYFRLNKDKDGESVHVSQRPPIRALVKKLGSSASGVNSKRQSKICNALRQLRKHRIYNRDIRTENYRDGLLVDFGSSITEPHIIFEKFEEDEKWNVSVEDVGRYKGMLDVEGIRFIHDPMVPLEPNVTTRSRAAQGDGRTEGRGKAGDGSQSKETVSNAKVKAKTKKQRGT